MAYQDTEADTGRITLEGAQWRALCGAFEACGSRAADGLVALAIVYSELDADGRVLLAALARRLRPAG